MSTGMRRCAPASVSNGSAAAARILGRIQKGEMELEPVRASVDESRCSGCRICKHTGWVEIGGAGMVDPDVFAHCRIDSERYSGFAFGMGLERMAMLRHAVSDIKFYYEGDLRFGEQF